MSGHPVDLTKMAGANTHEIAGGLLDPPTGVGVLDVGAGQGAFTEWLCAHGYRTFAIGLISDQYRFDGAPFIVANLDQGLPIRSESVEGIVAIEVLEHLEQPFQLVREAARCLQMGGWLIVTTPNVLSLGSKLSLFLRNYPVYFGPNDYTNNGHLSPVSRVELQRIASRAGLTIEAVTYNVGKLPFPRLRHRLPLTHPIFRNEWWGESLIVRLRKISHPAATVNRG
jgi:SAM-dependent methyltransferase